MTNVLRWTEEDLAAYERRQRTAGAGAGERATPKKCRIAAPAPAVLQVIGIDPGVMTGFALWDAIAMKFVRIESMGIIQAMRTVDKVRALHATEPDQLFVMFEDARLRKRFDKADQEEEGHRKGARREGVGSVKRDSSIWEEFLRDRDIPFKARRPMNTKWSADHFRRATKWEGRTNNHNRDAAVIVHGLNRPMVLSLIAHYRQESTEGRS